MQERTSVILNNCPSVFKVCRWQFGRVRRFHRILRTWQYQKQNHRKLNIKESLIKVSVKFRRLLWPDIWRNERYDEETMSTQILAEQPKAMAILSQGHFLSLTINSITKDCTILRDVMGNVGEICVLVKYSFKREKMLGSIVENIEREFEKSSRSDNQKLDKLCVTRWTIMAKCFKASLELWEQSLKENLCFDTKKSRTVGCKNQMRLFKFSSVWI